MENDDSRTSNVRRNALWSVGSTVALAVASFAVRTVFIRVLSAEYLGVNGLFTNILAILSFSELGIGTAINYALYRPISTGDELQIKALMGLFRNAYRIIAAAVLILGLLVVPLLPYLAKSTIPISEITIYYLVFLATTVSSYFVVYRTSYVTAAQHGYIVTNASAAGQIATYIVQIAVLLITKDFLVYLVVAFVVGVLKNVILSIYIGQKYPIVKSKQIIEIDEKTKDEIKTNVGALVIHKIGDVGVHQSDNIIVSMFVNTAAVGLLSNYTMVTTLITKLTNSLFGSVTASLGNLFASEGFERRRAVFDEYDMLGFILNCGILVFTSGIIQPFITLWAGKRLLVDNVTVLLLLYTIFLQGMCTVVYQFKIADGHYVEDRWIAFGQTLVNVVVSIAAIRAVGLPGVYIGTLVQRLLPVIVWPYITFKKVLGLPVRSYYCKFAFRCALAAALSVAAWWVTGLICPTVTIASFILAAVVSLLLAIGPLMAIYGRTAAFHRLAKRFVRR